MHYNELAEDTLWARALGKYGTVELQDRPSEVDKAHVLMDRLSAVEDMSSSDMRGRWFGFHDRCADVLPVWTAVLCALCYRDMCITGKAEFFDLSTMGKREVRLQTTSLDRGILRCITHILCNKYLRREAHAYIATHCTFRARSGQRTANRAPIGYPKDAHPWHGHAAVSASHNAHRATGGFIEELNETLTSVHLNKHQVKESSYMAAPAELEHGRSWRTALHQQTHSSIDAVVHEPQRWTTKTHPGPLLLQHLSSRVRSQGLYSFGIQAFAALVHAKPHVAEKRYAALIKRVVKSYEALGQCTKAPCPTTVRDDLRRLFRDDVFNETCALLLETESSMCTRPAKMGQTAHESWPEGGESRPPTEDTPAREKPITGWVGRNTLEGESRTKQADDVARETGYNPTCTQNCPCRPKANGLRRNLLAVCTPLHGTKFLVEDAFNMVRRATHAQSVHSKGKAAITSCTSYMAQHANSLRQEAPHTSTPVKMSFLDWEHEQQFGLEHVRTRLREQFVNRGVERCTPLYKAVRLACGEAKPAAGGVDSLLANFPSVQPKRALGCHLVQQLVTEVPYELWPHAWKQVLIPDGTILYSPALDVFRVKLSVPSPHMIACWPCAPTYIYHPLHGNQWAFVLTHEDATQPENIYRFAYVNSNPMRLASPCTYPNHEWYAVRSTLFVAGFGESLDREAPGTTISSPRGPLSASTASGNLDGASSDGRGLQVRTRVHLPPPLAVGECVPILEWAMEEGLPNTPVATMKELLREVELNLELEAKQGRAPNQANWSHPNSAKHQGHPGQEVFTKLLNYVCTHFSDDEKKAALERYVAFFFGATYIVSLRSSARVVPVIGYGVMYVVLFKFSYVILRAFPPNSMFAHPYLVLRKKPIFSPRRRCGSKTASPNGFVARIFPPAVV